MGWRTSLEPPKQDPRWLCEDVDSAVSGSGGGASGSAKLIRRLFTEQELKGAKFSLNKPKTI